MGSASLLGRAEGSQHINKNEEIINADNLDEEKMKLLPKSSTDRSHHEDDDEIIEIEDSDADESDVRQLNEDEIWPTVKYQQIPIEEDESVTTEASRKKSSAVINIGEMQSAATEDHVVNNQNATTQGNNNNCDAPATAGDGSNLQDDNLSGSDCRSYCVVPKCVSDLLERHKDGIKLIQLWLSFLILRISPFLFDLGLDIALLCDYGANGDWWYFSLTLFFVFFPSFIISVVNANYYDEKWDVKRQIKETDDRFHLKDKLIIDPEWKFHLRRIFCLLLISPLARYNFI